MTPRRVRHKNQQTLGTPHASIATAGMPEPKADLWLPRAKAKLDALGTMVRVDGYLEPPSSMALVLAANVLERLQMACLKPSKIVPIADGGVSLRFARPTILQGFRLEIENDGSLLIVCDRGTQDEPNYLHPEGMDDAVATLVGLALA